MCGLVGLIDLDGVNRDAVAPGFAAALDRLGPRGPDARGDWFDARAALGHTRLAIIDLSPGGLQPMVRHGLAITYNGEIYNYQTLREVLHGLGHRFETESDTEVLLAGWREWGEGLLPRLTGMFALMLWDSGSGTTVLARDRFGVKPLVYAHQGRRLAAASELVALRRVMPDVGGIDPEALRLFFALRFIPAPWSIHPNAAKLPPGHLAVFRDGALDVRRWYDLDAERAALPVLDDGADIAAQREATVELRRRVDSAVADRLVADVPVGTFLSGGIDSAIVASAVVAAGVRARTFTVGFTGAGDYYEERPAARQVAEHLGTDHTEIELGPDEALRAIPDMFAATDEPFADSSALPTYLLSRETRAHVTVALSGDAADEMFAGYRKHRGELWAERYHQLPAGLRHRVIEPLAARLPESKWGPWLERARRARRFLAHAGGDAAVRQAGWARLLSEPELDALLGPAWEGQATPEHLVTELRGGCRHADPINQMLFAEIGLGLPGDMLTKVDRMSMAHGLEVRCPFTDQRVAEWAATMPGCWKLGLWEGKRILRDAFRDRLPPAVFKRPKQGFEIPIDRWLAGPLAPLLDHATDPERLRGGGLIDPDIPTGWRRQLESGYRDTSWRLWALLAFTAWADATAGLA